MNGAVFLARRTRHDGHAGAQHVFVSQFQPGMTTTKDFREQFGQTGVHFVEGFFETGTGFAVNFGNRPFQRAQGFLQIVVLGIQIHLAFGLHLVFFNGRQVDGTQPLNPLGNAFQFLLPVGGVGLFRHILEHVFQGQLLFLQLFN